MSELTLPRAVLQRPERLPTMIAQALAEEIAQGRLAAGSMLPTEKILADTFKVSRGVVREAIAELRTIGLVQSRQGLGTIVASGSPAEQTGDDHGPVYELRLAVERQAAALAALRSTSGEREEIRLSHERMISGDWINEGIDADLAFHRAIARASQNPLTIDLLDRLGGRMRATIAATRLRSGPVTGEVRELTLSEHSAICEAICDRDPAAAAEAMSKHLLNAAHRLGYDLLLDAATYAIATED